MQQRVRALGEQLAEADEQAAQAQRALAEERQSSQQQRVHASASQQSEAALAAQVRSACEGARNGAELGRICITNAGIKHQVHLVRKRVCPPEATHVLFLWG